MASTSGSARVPGSRVTAPLTATRPSRIRRSPPRLEVSPACARILLSLSFAMLGRDGLGLRRVPFRRRQLGNHQLALDLRQVAEVAQAEGHEELARRLVDERAPGRLLASRDADEAPLEQVVEHTFGVDAAHGIDLRAR